MRKKLISNFFLWIVLVINMSGFVSCGSDDPVIPEKPKPHTEQIDTFVYSKNYEFTDINMYVGPNGEKKLFDEVFAKKTWGENENFGQPYEDTIIIFAERDSMYRKDEFSLIRDMIKKQNDSLFIVYRDEEVAWSSFFAKIPDDKTLRQIHGYYQYRKDCEIPREGVCGWGVESWPRKQTYENRFFKNGFFESPADMISPKDSVSWCNVYYEFKKLSK